MADRVTVAKSKITAIADAIRDKSGEEDALKLDDMPEIISNLNTELVCEIDFTEGSDCIDKVSGRKASWRDITWTFADTAGAGLDQNQSAIWLPVSFVRNADTIIELDIHSFSLVTSGTMQTLVAVGDGYEGRGIGYHTSNGVIGLRDANNNYKDSTESDLSLLDGHTITVEINRYGYMSMYDEDGNEIIKQSQYPIYNNMSNIYLGGYHSSTYGCLKNTFITAVRVYHRLSPNLNKINKLVYGFTAEDNYIENAIPVLTLDKGVDFSEFLSYNASDKKFTVLKDFDAHIILETYEYRSAGSNPQGELYINDEIVLKHADTSSFARPQGGLMQSGGNFSLTTGDTIYPRNPSSGGYALERVYIYKM